MSQGRSQYHDGKNPQRQLTGGSGSSQTLEKQLRSLHRTDVGSLHVGDHCEDWSVLGPLRGEARICPWHMSWLFGIYFLCWDALSSLDA